MIQYVLVIWKQHSQMNVPLTRLTHLRMLLRKDDARQINRLFLLQLQNRQIRVASSAKITDFFFSENPFAVLRESPMKIRRPTFPELGEFPLGFMSANMNGVGGTKVQELRDLALKLGMDVVAGGGVRPKDVKALAEAGVEAVHASCRLTTGGQASPLFDDAVHPVDPDKAMALVDAAQHLGHED